MNAAAGLLAEHSLPRVWANRWSEAAHTPALLHASTGWLSRGDVEQRSRAAADWFVSQGLRPGDRVLINATSAVPMAMAHVGALRAGLVVVPTNPAYTLTELDHVIADAAPLVAVVDNLERADELARTHSALPVIGPDSLVGSAGCSAVGGPPLDRSRADDPALLLYTSGTTGKPKGALLTHGNLLASTAAVASAWHWTAEDRLCLPLPLFHAHGLAVGLHGALYTGSSVVLQSRFDAGDVLEAVRSHGCTMLFGVPTMYHRLVGHPDVSDLARLRLAVCGSAPLSMSLHRAFENACGQRILERYGMTETLLAISNPYEGERRPGTVGTPLPGVELRLSAGSSGEILLRGPNVFGGYWRGAGGADVFDEDGFFRTGDVGEFDEHGYLKIIGRDADLIISGGYNVYPREVEEALRGLNGVHDAAVVGVPSSEWGESVHAFIVAAPSVRDEDLALHARAHLAPYKCPRSFHRVEEIPKNALGKVVRQHLQRLAAAGPS
jgi:malonyl-CoA/methylmalonyl-CoA synthetase